LRSTRPSQINGGWVLVTECHKYDAEFIAHGLSRRRIIHIGEYLDEALRYILGHDGVWNTTADDIAEYYIANYYDQVSSWLAEGKAKT
jgi:hypothetical protein